MPIESRLRENCMSGSVGRAEAAGHYLSTTSPDPTVVGVAPHRGVRESRNQGEGEQVIGHIETERYA